MKKFISMIMAAAMVVTMVPATAFAASADAKFKVIGAQEVTSTEAATIKASGITDAIELQIKMTEVNGSLNDMREEFDVTLKLTNAKFLMSQAAGLGWSQGGVKHGDSGASIGSVVLAEDVAVGDDTVELTVKEDGAHNFQDGDVVYIDLPAGTLGLTKTKVGTKATVTVSGDFGKSEALTFVAVVDKAIKAELDEDVADVAEEEITAIDDIVIKPVAGDNFAAVMANDAELTLKLSKGFEWANADVKVTANTLSDETTLNSNNVDIEENEITIDMTGMGALLRADKITFTNLEVEAVSAKAGDVATVTVKATGLDGVKVEVAKVIDYKVIMELDDEDEDVPVIYSGVNVANEGINDDSDHKSLAVSIYETFPGAWDMDKAFTLSLPEGVYVTAAELVGDNTMMTRAGEADATDAVLKDAYVEGGHVDFEFAKRTFVETDPEYTGRSFENEMTFVLTLVADPGFVGDVTLKLEGAAVDTQEVVIATFVSPMTVKAEQNDAIIDYRYTEVPTAIVVTEAEAGLWEKDLTIGFEMEEYGQKFILFEDDATITVNEASEMEVDEIDDKEGLAFEVTEESDEEAAVVTIDGIELFMQRNIPAGPYALDMMKSEAYEEIVLLGQVANVCHSDCDTGLIGDVCDYETTVHEAWINVVTAGRDRMTHPSQQKLLFPLANPTS